MGHILYTLFIFPIAEIIRLSFVLLYEMTDNYGISVIGLSFAVTLLSLPIYMVAERWQEIERKKVQSMESKVRKIKKAFHGDEQFMILSTYYRQQNYKPIYALRSSFSILIQIPFFLAAYVFLSRFPALKGMPFLFIRDMGAPDALLSLGGHSFNLLPLVMTAANCASGAIYSKGHPKREKAQIYGMAALFLIILYNSPAGLLLYWTMNNILSLVKNVFYKLRHPLMVFTILLVAGLLAFFPVIHRSVFNGNYKIAYLAVVLLIACSPLILKLLRSYASAATSLQAGKTATRFFLLSVTGFLLLVGAVVPLNLISSSPVEFSFLEPYSSPLSLVGVTFLQALGCFFIWPICLYFLFPPKVRVHFATLAVIALLAALADVYIFPGDYGTINLDLTYAELDVLSSSKALQIANIATLLAIIVTVVCCFLKGKEKMVRAFSYLLAVIILSLSAMSVIRMVSIQRSYREAIPLHEKQEKEDVEKEEHLEPVFTFSRKGKNVLLIMLDRAISGYVPDIFAEKPELREAFEGFTYYPQALSFGPSTIYGAAPLFGGYEYTPIEMQKRKDTLMIDKHNQALTLLPKIFSDAGYAYVTANPPYSNYKWTFDDTPFKSIKGGKAVALARRYRRWWENQFSEIPITPYSTVLESSLLRYSLSQAMPLFTHSFLYNKGKWLNITTSVYYSIDEAFANQYSTMAALPFITAVDERETGYLNCIDSELPHEPVMLPAPSYEPEPGLTLEGTLAEQHYCVNVASYLLLEKWFRYLKDNGVWDNTRIIIVSDHGRKIIDDDLEVAPHDLLCEYRALLMVKDFNSHSPFRVDNARMTNADVPSLALKDLFDHPLNPYTGKEINSKEKEKPLLILQRDYVSPPSGEAYQFPMDKGAIWIQNTGDIFDKQSWSVVQPK